MNIVFLRGALPRKSEHPEKLLYDSIAGCEDMWTQLFYYLVQELGARGELLYQGGDREFVVDSTFVERWVPSLSKCEPIQQPNLIVCRGGFPYYDKFVKRFPRASKVYYGAGKRFYPTTGYESYDLFLVDSRSQLKKICGRGRPASLYFKPAALLFKPEDVKKEFDVCFMANASQAKIKQHRLLLQSFAGSGVRILNLGNTNNDLVALAKKLGVDIEWGGWLPRKDLPKEISKCRVGVCCSTSYDSCPRVIPEYLACGLPVVVVSGMNLWYSKYIVPETGMSVAGNKLLYGVKELLKRKLNVVEYYNRHLSMAAAAGRLSAVIEEVL